MPNFDSPAKAAAYLCERDFLARCTPGRAGALISGFITSQKLQDTGFDPGWVERRRTARAARAARVAEEAAAEERARVKRATLLAMMIENTYTDEEIVLQSAVEYETRREMDTVEVMLRRIRRRRAELEAERGRST